MKYYTGEIQDIKHDPDNDLQCDVCGELVESEERKGREVGSKRYEGTRWIIGHNSCLDLEELKPLLEFLQGRNGDIVTTEEDVR